METYGFKVSKIYRILLDFSKYNPAFDSVKAKILGLESGIGYKLNTRLNTRLNTDFEHKIATYRTIAIVIANPKWSSTTKIHLKVSIHKLIASYAKVIFGNIVDNDLLPSELKYFNDRFDTDYVRPYKILLEGNWPQLVNPKTFRRVSVCGFKSIY